MQRTWQQNAEMQKSKITARLKILVAYCDEKIRWDNNYILLQKIRNGKEKYRSGASAFHIHNRKTTSN